MRKFLLLFQWVAALLVPFLLTFGPNLMFSLKTDWLTPFIPWVMGLASFIFLTAVAAITTRKSASTKKRKVSSRVATALQAIYGLTIASLVTAGSRLEEWNNPALVSVLMGRGASAEYAWSVNTLAQAGLHSTILLLLFTVFFIAIREKYEPGERYTAEISSEKN